MHYLNEQNIFIFLVQVFLLLGLARTLGELFRKWKQPTLTAEILVGILLGPTIFGRFLPFLHQIIFPKETIQQNMLETVAWLGVLFFLLKTGLELDFSSAWRQRGDALKISFTDLTVPMVVAFIPCLFLPAYYMGQPNQRLIFALFIATIMTISALPVTARVLHDLNLYKTDVGFLIMCALSVNDLIGWMIFTLILGFFTQVNLEFGKILTILASTIGFTVFCLTAGRHLANYAISKIKEKRLPEPSTSLTFICLLGILCGAATLKIGIHALFGFFIAGIMAGEAKALPEKTRHVISEMVYAIFIPLFFANVGLKIDFFNNFDIFLVIFIIIIGIFGRFLGAWLGVTFTKHSRANRFLISIAHIPGGEMQIVVGIRALEYGLITECVFVAIVFGAVVSSIMLGPLMSYALKRRKEINILEYFLRRAILPELKAGDRDSAIRELSLVVAEQENLLNAEEVYSAVINRENAMGTAIEEGVAFPHAYIPALRSPIIGFGRSVEGIEWNSPDGKPTHFIFLILSPLEENGTQLQILRLIATAMGDKKTRDAIMEAKETKEIWEVLGKSFSSHQIIRRL